MVGVNKEKIYDYHINLGASRTKEIFNRNYAINGVLGIKYVDIDGELYGGIYTRKCMLSTMIDKSNNMVELCHDRIKIKTPRKIGRIKIICISELIASLMDAIYAEVKLGNAGLIKSIKYIDFSESDLRYTISTDDIIEVLKDNKVGVFNIILPTGANSMRPYIAIDVLGNSECIGNPEEVLTSIDYSEAIIFLIGGIYCSGDIDKLKELDFTGKRFNKLTSTAYIFYGCCNLEKVKFSKGALSNARDTHNMFNGCYKLKEFNMDAFYKAELVDATYMFNACKSLKKVEIDCGLRNIFSEKEAVVMPNMFSGCSEISTYTVESFIEFAVNSKNIDPHQIGKNANIDKSYKGFNRIKAPNKIHILKSLLGETLEVVWDMRGYRAYDNGKQCGFNVLSIADSFDNDFDTYFKQTVKVIVLDKQTYIKTRRKKILGRSIHVIECNHEDTELSIAKAKMFAGEGWGSDNSILVIVDTEYDL